MRRTTWREELRGRRARLADASALAMRALLRPLAAQGRFHPAPQAPGRRRLLILQLDGVSHGRLRRGLAQGLFPSLARRLDEGRLRLSRFRSGLPSSTPAFQAGLFYGRAPAVPAFIWYDRRTRRQVRMDRAADAAALEAELRRFGPGLLRGGSSYYGILTGGAAMPRFCLSGMGGGPAPEPEAPRPGAWDLTASALAHSVTAFRGALRLAVEAGAGVVDGLRWTAALGRLQHEPRFLLHRSFVPSVLRELAVQGVLVDLSRGLPAIYADFLAFDEAAHRRGPDAPAAQDQLPGMDQALGTILSAVEAAPELGYDVYVLSDHGNVPTRPFEQLAGVSLPELVARAERGEPLPRHPIAVPPNRGFAGGRSLGQKGDEAVVTAEAGDIGHVYFVREAAPLTLEGIRARHWRVLAALSASPAVGLLAARGGRRGLAVLHGTVLDLDDPDDVGRLPHPEPALLARYLSELLALADTGDLVVLGWRGEGREVVAYAWEFGSHGGIAPEVLDCFIAHPPDVDFDFGQVVRPSALHEFFEARYRRDEVPVTEREVVAEAEAP